MKPGHITYLLEWHIANGGKNGQVRLTGRLFEHPELEDDTIITTAPIAFREHNIIITSDGQSFRLSYEPLEIQDDFNRSVEHSWVSELNRSNMDGAFMNSQGRLFYNLG